ncbi:MAG: hypothetical protein EA376_01650 [Phycisphaeraceae bacterium]|nr:MAG: hypothetical protein EA376_01650 [Phycisphaeraceae bacterium]
MSDGDKSHLIYAGVDEAGYGPRLGPLCVANSVLRIDSWTDGAPAPDIWELLSGVVGRTPVDAARGLVAVNDSKRLKLANNCKIRHPLTHLERGVLSCLSALDRPAHTDLALFDALDAALESHPWYAGEPLPCPLSTTPDHLRVTANALAAGLQSRGVTVLDLQCETICETAFNSGVRESGSKAAVSFGAARRALRRIWQRWGEEAPRVVIDRQGGRRSYGPLLQHTFPGCEVRTTHEAINISRYEIHETAAPADGRRPRRMVVQFQVEADSAHFPTALASMAAKLVRERAMLRFNRYWSDRIPELKPTAGYGLDARRWLEEIGPVVSRNERDLLVRRA